VNGRLLMQLSWVAMMDEQALRDDYAYPRKELTTEERGEADRLRALANRLHYAAVCAGQTESGLDAVFGEGES
jgi:hypothetical protein